MTINKNSFRGRTANKSGQFFETLVEYSCARYKQAKIADIQKTPEPMKILKPINRSRGTFEAVFAKQAQPDFKGVLCGGRMIMFEAKRTKATSIAKDRISMIILASAGTGFVVFLLAALALKLSKVYTVYQDLKEKDADINKAIMDADEREMWG